MLAGRNGAPSPWTRSRLADLHQDRVYAHMPSNGVSVRTLAVPSSVRQASSAGAQGGPEPSDLVVPGVVVGGFGPELFDLGVSRGHPVEHVHSQGDQLTRERRD